VREVDLVKGFGERHLQRIGVWRQLGKACRQNRPGPQNAELRPRRQIGVFRHVWCRVQCGSFSIAAAISAISTVRFEASPICPRCRASTTARLRKRPLRWAAAASFRH
jgi:hypothetical protein